MVSPTTEQTQPDFDQKDGLKWCSVPLTEVIDAGKRLDASLYELDSRRARARVENGRWALAPLCDEERGLVKSAYYPMRFKRIYCERENGVPFYLPSQVLDLDPRPEKFISPMTDCDFQQLRLRRGDLLLTRSGTIGNCTLVTKTLENAVFSDDVIRVTPANEGDLGYLYAYFHSPTGRTILQTNRYGSVIQHIEPEHLAHLPVPLPPKNLRHKIGKLILESFALRDESNQQMHAASSALIEALALPPLFEMQGRRIDQNVEFPCFNIKLNQLEERLDASYHNPAAKAIVDHLKKHSAELTAVKDKRFSSGVVLPGRFKRIYVDEAHGIKFIGGKEIHQLNPVTNKFLSKTAHQKQLAGPLGIKKYSILTPARGSLGTVALTCPHFCDWAISDNVMQILSNEQTCGYLYLFLDSEYGSALIRRYTYGGVVDAIEPFHIQEVPVPVLKDAALQRELNRMALQANDQRYRAYLLEMEALALLEREVLAAE